VESKTNEKIKDLIPEGVLDDLTRLVITNAIYFKGTWVTQFDEKNTVEEDFVTDTGNTVQVPMMKLEEAYFKYAETDLLQVVELPYQGDKVSMLILLPRDSTDLSPVEESLTLDNLSLWKNSLRNQTVTVEIPKFNVETEYTLNELLIDLGMPSAFDPSSADLSGITEQEELYIAAALHKAFVEVNEEGTEAAAATGVVIGTTSAPIIPLFRADHPFIFIIQDSDTGNILFMGRVSNPLA
jgi:serpin B